MEPDPTDGTDPFSDFLYLEPPPFSDPFLAAAIGIMVFLPHFHFFCILWPVTSSLEWHLKNYFLNKLYFLFSQMKNATFFLILIWTFAFANRLQAEEQSAGHGCYMTENENEVFDVVTQQQKTISSPLMMNGPFEKKK